jgi:hypothetical protein
VREYIARLNSKDEDPATKLFTGYDEFLTARPNLTGPERGALSSATLDAANQIYADTRDKQAEEQARTDNNFTRGACALFLVFRSHLSHFILL